MLANRYLASQQEKAKRGLITVSHFGNCLATVRRFVAFVGTNRAWDDLRPQDFGAYRMILYDQYGIHAISRTINILRAMFKHAYETDQIDRPVKYGGQFDRPSLKEHRQSRSRRDRENGRRLFEPGEIRQMLDASGGQLYAMILLGINGGFGNTDCAELPIAAVDLDQGLIEYERPKTAVQRTMPLWPETDRALRHVLDNERPVPQKPEYKTLVFLTRFGNPWKKEVYKEVVEDTDGQPGCQEAVSPKFGKMLDRLGIRRPGVGFYALRHTFRTWADETLDQHAIHRIMGHVGDAHSIVSQMCIEN